MGHKVGHPDAKLGFPVIPKYLQLSMNDPLIKLEVTRGEGNVHP